MKNFNQSRSSKTVLVFRKWGRRNYSLFSTLKKIVHISVLSVAYFFTVPDISKASVRDTSDVKMQYDIDEVEVTASRLPMVYSQLARVLTVIEAQEIERMPAESIQDLLEYVAGIDIRQRGAEGVQADISIRGGTFDQILILLNGINITDPQTGHHNLNLPVSLSQIERIEVLKGPAARVYGPNSFSGAINIITRSPQSKSAFAQISTGSFGYFNSDLSGSFFTGKFGHSLSANHKQSDGYITNTDFKSSNLFYTGELKTGAGKLVLQGGLSDKRFGANSFYTPVYPNQFEKTQTILGSARYVSVSKVNFTPSVYWRRHSDVFMLFRNESPEWYTNHNYHLTDVWGTDINTWFVWTGGKTSFGTGLRSESILSNVLGEPLIEEIEIKGENAAYTHSKNRLIGSVYAEHAFFLENLTMNAGLMANVISNSQQGVNFFPGIDFSYQFQNNFKIIGSWNTSLRMPTFTDLYYSGPTNTGNPDLKPERSSAFEGGFKLNTAHVKGHLVAYHRLGKNLIDWIKLTAEDEVWQSMNHTEIRSAGIDFQIVYLPGNEMNFWVPEKIEAGYLFNHQNKGDSPYISYYVLDNLRHKLSGSFTFQLPHNLALDVRAVFQDREGTFTFYNGEGFSGEKDFEPFGVLDMKASWQLSRLNLFFSINNIGNKQYYDVGNIVQPGRWIKAGASFAIIKAE